MDPKDKEPKGDELYEAVRWLQRNVGYPLDQRLRSVRPLRDDDEPSSD